MRQYFFISISVLTIFIFFGCWCDDSHNKDSKRHSKQDNIVNIFETKELRAAIENNSSSYFIFRGAPMGYHYELLNRFAQKYDLKLSLITCRTPEEALKALEEGKCDMIAMNMTVTNDRTKQALFTMPLREAYQVLVQRKPDNWRKMTSREEIEHQLIRQPLQLAGKTVVVPKGSSYEARLKNIMEEIGDTIFIKEADSSEEELFDAVAKGSINFTVCDDHDATLNGRYYPNINSKIPISFNQKVSWAVALENTALCDSLNLFLDDFLKTSDAVVIFNKYYRFPTACRMARATQHSQGEGCITLWDETLKQTCQKYELNWLLMASLMYQESKFDTEAYGPKGAFGLMQMMPETMEQYDIDSLSLPEEQIVAGIKHLKSLEKSFITSVPDSTERLKFMVASYNSGPGHILDAQRLAKKAGKNPALWDDVADKLLDKTDPNIYRNDADIRHGYCNGQLTVNYVQEIFERYKHYQTIFSN